MRSNHWITFKHKACLGLVLPYFNKRHRFSHFFELLALSVVANPCQGQFFQVFAELHDLLVTFFQAKFSNAVATNIILEIL